MPSSVSRGKRSAVDSSNSKRGIWSTRTTSAAAVAAAPSVPPSNTNRPPRRSSESSDCPRHVARGPLGSTRKIHRPPIPAAARSPSRSASTSPAMAHSAQYPSEADQQRVKLTKTGRVSKALKGAPVHKCSVCDKVYTRNEHLRRHQLNHSGQALKCDVRGCGKQFARADLLNRHKEEHNEAGTGRRSSSSSIQRQRSLAQDGSFSSSDRHNSLPNTEPVSQWASSRPFPPVSSYSFSKTISPVTSSSYGGSIGARTSSLDLRGTGPLHHYLDSDPLQSPSMISTYLPGQMPPHQWYTRENALPENWTAPTNASGSRSPASASSSAPQVWQQDGPRYRAGMSPTDSDVSMYIPYGTAPSNNFFDAENNASWPSILPSPNQDAVEEETIIRDLAGIPDLPRSSDSRSPLGPELEERCLTSFWMNFHPMFSIIHRPTFGVVGTSPLVKALMLTIGAQFLLDEIALDVARTLRETCTNLIAKRHSLEYSMSRLWDLQAVFLAEALSLYCSRRPLTRFSQKFEDLLAGLHTDRDNVFFAKPLEALAGYGGGVDNSADDRHIQWVHLESKRRLLLACYILEVQHSSIFGSMRQISDKNLPSPCTNSLWEADSIGSWLSLAQRESKESFSLSDALHAGYADGNPDQFFLNTAIAYSTHAALARPNYPDAEFPQNFQQSPRLQMSYHAALLSVLVPIRDLLAVSGETFVLGEKLATRDQFIHAGTELRQWLYTKNAPQAFTHAQQLLGIAFKNGRAGLLHEDWALYIASLVCWAFRMWPVQDKVGAAASIPVQNADAQMMNFVYASNDASTEVDWSGARACLAWVRKRIMGRLGGALEDAVGVLTKLLDGRIIKIDA